jgi:hypothetical protein
MSRPSSGASATESPAASIPDVGKGHARSPVGRWPRGGAGISRESGLSTFRNADGIWAKLHIKGSTRRTWRLRNSSAAGRARCCWLRRTWTTCTSGPGAATSSTTSFGCQVLVELPSRHLVQVDQLVLQGPGTDPTARTLPAQLRNNAID